MFRGLLMNAEMLPSKGIPMLTRGGASFGLRRSTDMSARNTHAIRAPPASSAVCGISRIASIALSPVVFAHGVVEAQSCEAFVLLAGASAVQQQAAMGYDDNANTLGSSNIYLGFCSLPHRSNKSKSACCSSKCRAVPALASCVCITITTAFEGILQTAKRW